MPVALTEIKQYLKINHDHDDELLKSLVFAVARRCESYTGLSLITSDWRAHYEEFCRELHIPIRPLQKVTSIKVIHDFGSITTVPDSLYNTKEDSISFKGVIPLGRVHIYFVAGFGDGGDDIPYDLKMVMLEHLSDLYENRGNRSTFTMDGYNDFRLFKI